MVRQPFCVPGIRIWDPISFKIGTTKMCFLTSEYSVTIYRNKILSIFYPYFIVTTFFQKVKREMKSGHFKNVQKRKPEKSFEKGVFFHFCTIMVTIIFSGFEKL